MSGGEIPVDELRRALHEAADLVADYLERIDTLPVLPPTVPGDVARALPETAPLDAEPLDRILDDYRRLIEPNLTHWNHPGFMAYFGITGSAPGIVAETLSAATNVNAMLWRTAPAATELEERVCDWLRRMVGLPDGFRGHINDTASVATFLMLGVAREQTGLEIRRRGLAGRSVPPLTVYASDQAHSSVDKAVLALGLGLDQLRRIESDEGFRLSVPALARAIRADRESGCRPIAVVATIGTTVTNAIDPVPEIAELCAREGLWMHVDAAYAGSAAVCPELRPLFAGWERADSIVINPHKWLFTPFDCSVLLARRPELIREAYSVVPDYLKTSEEGVTNLMDYGIQLGRRFRALKLWMVIRAYGVEGLRERLRTHCSLAAEIAGRLAADPRFELVVEPPFSTVCFRLRADDGERQDRLNARLLESLNAAGSLYLGETLLGGRVTLRVTLGNIRTGRDQVETLFALLDAAADELLAR